MRGFRSVAMPLVTSHLWGRESFAVTLNVVLAVAMALVSASCASRSPSVPTVPPIPEPPSVPSSETSKPPSEPETEPPSTPSSETGSPEASSNEAPSASEVTGASESAASSAEKAASQSTESGARGQVEVSRASTSSGGAPSASGPEPSEGAQGGVQTAGEKQAGLEGKLDKSLSEFDELLLKEQELLEERREDSAVDPAGGGGAAGDEAGGGGESETGELEGSDRAEAGGATGGSPDRPQADPVESAPGAPMGDETDDQRDDRVPPDVGDGSNDDIVARQLREAAMKEEDPELREKLWDEYRTYKQGTSGKKK